jgi:hypothetical protein
MHFNCAGFGWLLPQLPSSASVPLEIAVRKKSQRFNKKLDKYHKVG